MKHVIIRENTKITAINLDLCSDFIFIPLFMVVQK
jgi:hypothetical protein